MSDRAIEAMTPYLKGVYGNPSSLHTVGQIAKEHLEDAREKIAKCLNCEPKEIYFTSGGSEADNQAIRSAAINGARKGKKHIITTAFEHHAVLHTLKKLEKEGYEVTYLPVHHDGLITAEEVAEAIRPDTALVTVMFANNEVGTVLSIAEIGAVCRKAGVVFHTDAVQAVGHVPAGQNTRVHRDRIPLPLYPAAKVTEDGKGIVHIGEPGTVAKQALPPGQKGGCQNGQHTVFGPLDPD